MKDEQHATTETPGYHNRFGFPYRTTLSFLPYIKIIEQKAKDTTQPDSVIMRHVMKEIKKCPELLAPIEDLAIVDKYRRQIDLMLSTLLPTSTLDSLIAGIIIPFQPVMIYGSESFRKLFRVQDNGIWDIHMIDPVKLYTELITFAGMGILFKHYKVEMNQPDIFKSREIDKHTNTTLFLLPEINNMFTEVKVKKTPKPLEEIDFSPLKENIFNPEFWLTNFPPDTFEFEGITVYRMTDITNRESISQLEYSLLQTGSFLTAERVESIQEKFRSYFRDAELVLGVAPIFMSHNSLSHCGLDNWYCLMPRDKAHLMFENFENSVYNEAIKSKGVYVEDDLMKMTNRTPIEEELLRTGIRSLLLVPILSGDKLIGAFELGSPKPGAFNFLTLLKVREILPIITVAFERANEDFDNRLQSSMKEYFTAIHPAVEWKFIDSILHVVQGGNKPGTVIPPIQFDDVIPVYGQIDIRGSSDRRNEAIRLDIIDYLHTATSILKDAHKKFPLAIFDELLYRAGKHIKKLEHNLDSGEETGILDFMSSEVQPALRTISHRDEVLKKSSEHFFQSLLPHNEFYHMRRRDFEQSLTLINDTVAHILDEEESKTQQILSHYFEKYKTDGVEYNIYLGASLLQNEKFDYVYVKSFRLWQLISMVNIARETHRLQSVLSVPLDTTQLILCYSNPFSVMFRMDEKRFDVAGAYNIRYEIVKKRIDKAHIKDTTERITQPGTIAIIYTQEKEEREYERYFEYLQARGFIESSVEHLEVEPLQGIQGLKAMRIKINYDLEEPKLQWDEEELFRQIKGEMV